MPCLSHSYSCLLLHCHFDKVLFPFLQHVNSNSKSLKSFPPWGFHPNISSSFSNQGLFSGMVMICKAAAVVVAALQPSYIVVHTTPRMPLFLLLWSLVHPLCTCIVLPLSFHMYGHIWILYPEYNEIPIISPYSAYPLYMQGRLDQSVCVFFQGISFFFFFLFHRSAFLSRNWPVPGSFCLIKSSVSPTCRRSDTSIICGLLSLLCNI